MMKKLGAIVAVILIGATLCGCTGQRWAISDANYSYESVDNDDTNYEVQMTVLLDTKTGDTWMLWANDEAECGFAWMPMASAK